MEVILFFCGSWLDTWVVLSHKSDALSSNVLIQDFGQQAAVDISPA